MEGKKTVFIVGFVVLFVIATIFLFGGAGETKDFSDFNGITKEFDVVVSDWEFNPSVIEVNEGEKVIINFNVISGDHGVALSDFGVYQDLKEGESYRVEFIANKKGEFEFFCNVMCGPGHRDMNGFLKVK